VQTHANVTLSDDGFLVSGTCEVLKLIPLPMNANTNASEQCDCSSNTVGGSFVTPPPSPISPPPTPPPKQQQQQQQQQSSPASFKTQEISKVKKPEYQTSDKSNKIDSIHPQLADKLSALNVNVNASPSGGAIHSISFILLHPTPHSTHSLVV
jgi:hypothetical protein